MTISTNINYPSKYLPGVLKDGFGLKAASPMLRTQLTSGRVRQRRAFTSTPSNTDVQWLLNDKQAQFFEVWFRDTLKDGASWFNMPLLTPLGLQNYVCRFTDIYEGPTPEGGLYWRYSANLELWERPVLSSGWAEFPEYILGSDIFDIAINREWPEK